MEILDALILGIIQGITEFLPISSSGHLVLGESFLGLEVEALKSFDIAVHMGTLVAIIGYFWRDFAGLIRGFLSLIGILKKREQDKEYRWLIGYIVVATIPAVFFGLFLEDGIDYLFRNPLYVGIWMIIVGEVFWIAEGAFKKKKEESKLGWKNTFIIGIAQAMALIPGVSRSGSTIAAGIFQGISREKAARFSFLLGMPAIAGAGLLTGLKGGMGDVEIEPMLVGFVASAIFGFFAVYFLMKFLKKHSLKVFAVYLFIVGGITVLWNLL